MTQIYVELSLFNVIIFHLCSRQMVVCRVKAFPTAGVLTVKAPFGFRVIQAARQHVYRLSWELHLPSPITYQPSETQRSFRDYSQQSFEV